MLNNTGTAWCKLTKCDLNREEHDGFSSILTRKATFTNQNKRGKKNEHND